ncbi:MAG: radical SAM protein [Betaproteobacteria bacterium]|nr:radical SAM protein [Betaproteobacteria bacterium]
MAKLVIDLLKEQQKRYDELKVAYQNFPSMVHLETFAACNATCSFCVYPDIRRKGTRMSDDLIDKVIADLTAITKPFTFLPFKLSDPFMEPRLARVLKKVNFTLPLARIEIVTNGNLMTAEKLKEVAAIGNICKLVVSLNYCQADIYRRMMGLDFDRTLQRLDILHRMKIDGEIYFTVMLRRFGTYTSDDDRRFVHWAHSRYPAFKVELIWTNDWLGDRRVPRADSCVPNIPCPRWFDLSITATGEVAYCCMDGDAKYVKGNVNSQNAIDIYNQPELSWRRKTGMTRQDAGLPCNRCNYLQASLTSKVVHSAAASKQPAC